MEQKDIQEKVVGIIKPFVKNEAALASVSGETRILEDLKVNSARLVDIILEFENAFDITVDDDEAQGVRTVGDAVRVIAKKKA